jgi:hypothetical protein
MGNAPFLLLFLCFFSINFLPSTFAIWLTLPASGTKCVSEEIQNNVVVLADYVVVPDDHTRNPTLAVKVRFFPFILSPFSLFFRGLFFNFAFNLLFFIPLVLICLVFRFFFTPLFFYFD